MLASVGIPEGGISQPARGSREKTERIAAMNRERMSPTPNCMAFPLVEPAPKEPSAFGRFSESDCCMSAVARASDALPRAQVYARQRFQGLGCAFAQLFP